MFPILSVKVRLTKVDIFVHAISESLPGYRVYTFSEYVTARP